MRTDSITLTMPETMDEWTSNHSSTVDKVQAYLRKKGKAAQESEIWQLIAQDISKEWRTAHEIVSHVAEQLKEASNEFNMPLGAIGAALGGAELDIVIRAHNEANAHFIVIDESLRQERGPSALLDQGMKHVTALHMSAAAEKKTREAARQFKSVTRPRGSLMSTLSETFDGGKPSQAFSAINSIFRSALPKTKPAEPQLDKPQAKKPNAGMPGFGPN